MASEIEVVDARDRDSTAVVATTGGGGGTGANDDNLRNDVYTAAAYGDLEKLQRLVESEIVCKSLTPPPASLISASRRQILMVKDYGCGVEPQDFSHLFTKFSKTQNGSVRSNDGTGLGLGICKRFVNLMGGNIWIESEGLGKGTTVTVIVKLGLYKSPNEPVMQQRVVPRGVRATPVAVNLLVIDNSETMITKCHLPSHNVIRGVSKWL